MNEEINKLIKSIDSTTVKDNGSCITLSSLTNTENVFEICKKDQAKLYHEIKKYFKFSNK